MSGEAVRGAFCHDDFVASDERAACVECRTVLHWDCRALLGRCPTMGCKDAAFKTGGRVVRERPGFRAALERHFARMPLPRWKSARASALRAAIGSSSPPPRSARGATLAST